MALTFTSAYMNSSDNAPSVSVPAGASSGDSFVFTVTMADDLTITWPAGFTEIAESAYSAAVTTRVRTAVRTATGSESGSFTATMSSYTRWIAACVLVPGSSTLDDSDSTLTAVGYTNAGVTYNETGGSVTSAGAATMVWIGSGRVLATTCTSTPTLPSGFTSAGTVDNGTGGVIFIGDKAEGSAGSYSYIGTLSHNQPDTRTSLVTTLAFATGGGGGSTILRQMMAHHGG